MPALVRAPQLRPILKDVNLMLFDSRTVSFTATIYFPDRRAEVVDGSCQRHHNPRLFQSREPRPLSRRPPSLASVVSPITEFCTPERASSPFPRSSVPDDEAYLPVASSSRPALVTQGPADNRRPELLLPPTSLIHS